MPITEISEILGLIGVILVLAAYFLLQIEKLKADSFIYSFANLLGSILVLYSLWYSWNLPSVFVEAAWVLISLYGIYKWLRHRQ